MVYRSGLVYSHLPSVVYTNLCGLQLRKVPATWNGYFLKASFEHFFVLELARTFPSSTQMAFLFQTSTHKYNCSYSRPHPWTKLDLKSKAGLQTLILLLLHGIKPPLSQSMRRVNK
jgi:hypothetical protein